MHIKRWLSAFYSLVQATSGEMTSLAGHFPSRPAPYVISCNMTGNSCEVQPCRAEMHPKHELSALYSLLQATSGEMTLLLCHFRACDVIFCHVTGTSYKLQHSNS